MTEQWRVPSQDSKGHSDRVQFRAHPGQLRQAQEIANRPNCPYKTVSDLYRHALKRHLEWLATQEGFQPTVDSQLDAILRILEEEERRAVFEAEIDKADTIIWNRIKSGGEEAAKDIVAEIHREVLKMPEEYWRTRYLNEIRKRWGHLLRPWNMTETEE